MSKQRNYRKLKSLASGRPPLARKSGATLSSKATRTIIRRHHTLLKEHEKAIKAGQAEAASRIAQQIEVNGGLEKYQQASQIGQLNARGGDTSQVLVSWLQEHGIVSLKKEHSLDIIRLLEVGCLSPSNAISKCSNVDLTRIDLHSTHPTIIEQDFMQRPLPSSEQETFDIVSLSLVVNFVGEASGRGDMLRRTTQFLRDQQAQSNTTLPGLFLTLPLPCVTNSRYLDVHTLVKMMATIGYNLLASKLSSKIYYSFWRYDSRTVAQDVFKKKELLSGGSRNNFYIAMG